MRDWLHRFTGGDPVPEPDMTLEDVDVVASRAVRRRAEVQRKEAIWAVREASARAAERLGRSYRV